MARYWRAVAALATTTFPVFMAFGCWQDPTPDGAYVHVFLAVQQPQSNNLGVIVDVQSDGGTFLSLVADQGTVRLLPTGDGGTGASGACTPIAGGAIVSFLVVPTQTETILFANLYDSDPALTSASAGDAYCHATTSPVATSVTPIAHTVNTQMTDASAPGPDAADGDSQGTSEGGEGLDATADSPVDAPTTDAAADDATDGG